MSPCRLVLGPAQRGRGAERGVAPPENEGRSPVTGAPVSGFSLPLPAHLLSPTSAPSRSRWGAKVCMQRSPGWAWPGGLFSADVFVLAEVGGKEEQRTGLGHLTNGLTPPQ